MLDSGDDAPDFTAISTDGSITLSDLNDPVVLFFFPKAGSPICTREACHFQSSIQEFNDLDASIVGISPNDTLDDLNRFKESNNLEYPLISDSDGVIADRFGVDGIFGLIDKRVTFIIDNGVIQGKIDSMLRAKTHVERSLESIREKNESQISERGVDHG